jgi:hypothetical protein
MSNRFYPEWTITDEMVAYARGMRNPESEVASALSYGGFSESWRREGSSFSGSAYRPCVTWGPDFGYNTPLSPEQILAVADGYVKPVAARPSHYRITSKGMALLRKLKRSVPMFVRGRCGWQGSTDGEFILQTVYYTKEGPSLRIPSPLSAAPGAEGGGIFSNDGAILSYDAVKAFRDQLDDWIVAHTPEPHP